MKNWITITFLFSEYSYCKNLCTIFLEWDGEFWKTVKLKTFVNRFHFLTIVSVQYFSNARQCKAVIGRWRGMKIVCWTIYVCITITIMLLNFKMYNLSKLLDDYLLVSKGTKMIQMLIYFWSTTSNVYEMKRVVVNLKWPFKIVNADTKKKKKCSFSS